MIIITLESDDSKRSEKNFYQKYEFYLKTLRNTKDGGGRGLGRNYQLRQRGLKP